ncbi:hypothetical protein L6452_15290 [Arctium lappa]|uniref:Uncharacterized protein n=1 Tax=Arctium lappa TaxID=4217 RepID=A0ACB9CNZ0_ARCLA|nr:hypothetical protein L6452_15290 [Arctium lappa]
MVGDGRKDCEILADSSNKIVRQKDDLLKEVICSLQWRRTARQMAIAKMLSTNMMIPTKIMLGTPSLHM